MGDLYEFKSTFDKREKGECYISYNAEIAEGVEFARAVTILSGTIIYPDCKIGDNVFIGHYGYLREGTVIEDNVHIGNFFQSEGENFIGKGTKIHTNVHITSYSCIGERCFIAPGFVCTNTKCPLCERQSECRKGVTIGNDVKIGANVTTLPGITIGRNSLIGCGSVITKDIPANVVAVGNPCKPVKSIEDVACNIDGHNPYSLK